MINIKSDTEKKKKRISNKDDSCNQLSFENNGACLSKSKASPNVHAMHGIPKLESHARLFKYVKAVSNKLISRRMPKVSRKHLIVF